SPDGAEAQPAARTIERAASSRHSLTVIENSPFRRKGAAWAPSWIDASSPPLRLRVLPGQLGRQAFQLLLRTLQARFARPGALQLVAHADVQRAEALGRQLDLVSVLERRQPAVIGAGGEDVARLERVYRAHP